MISIRLWVLVALACLFAVAGCAASASVSPSPAGMSAPGPAGTTGYASNQKLLDAMGRPVDHIAAGMDGRVRTSPEVPAWARAQLLTAEQALRSVTLDAAYALGDEARRGHLAPGTLGDVTILSGDVMAATPDEIRAMTVIATIVGGELAFCGEPEMCSQAGA